MVSTNANDIEIRTETDRRAKTDSNKKLQAQHPIELEYWFILPALRRSVAQTLKNSGMKQKQVAKILGITEAGVSQYLKGSRGVLKTKEEKVIFFPDWITDEVSKSCSVILEDPEDHNNFLKEMNRLLTSIRDRPLDFLCMLHNEYGLVDDNCDVCLNG